MLVYTVKQRELISMRLELKKRTVTYVTVYNCLSDEFEEPEKILQKISSKTKHSITKMQLIGILTILCNYGLALRKKAKTNNGRKPTYIYKKGDELDE